MPPGAKSNTLRFFAEHVSIPGIPEHAFEIFSLFDTTKRALLPIFDVRPRNATLPVLFFLPASLYTSWLRLRLSNTLVILLVFEISSTSSVIIIGKEVIPSSL